MPGMSGSSRLINGRMRRSHGAWRLRRLRGHRSLRLLRDPVVMMSLERVMVALTLLMMELLIIPRTSQLPKALRRRSGRRRCTSRPTTMQTSWGP